MFDTLLENDYLAKNEVRNEKYNLKDRSYLYVSTYIKEQWQQKRHQKKEKHASELYPVTKEKH